MCTLYYSYYYYRSWSGRDSRKCSNNVVCNRTCQFCHISKSYRGSTQCTRRLHSLFSIPHSTQSTLCIAYDMHDTIRYTICMMNIVIVKSKTVFWNFCPCFVIRYSFFSIQYKVFYIICCLCCVSFVAGCLCVVGRAGERERELSVCMCVCVRAGSVSVYRE